MERLTVSLDWLDNLFVVGELQIHQTRGQSHYQFSYHRDWLTTDIAFAIDPVLELAADIPYRSNRLWGVFQDISPDRWGRLVQSKTRQGYLSDCDYMLGVSDHMRMGGLRLSHTDTAEYYLASHKNVPKLMHAKQLETAARHLENGTETAIELALLSQPSSSLGGAHPKAAVEDKGQLWIAKFQSKYDIVRISSWEATLLDLAAKAGIRVTAHRLLNPKGKHPILLVKRFDRHQQQRIPFVSAMTLLERNEDNREGASYLELSDAIARYSMQPTKDKQELWQRMTFNAMTGNTDDHLRNHGFLRQPQGWMLSPVYDLNPTAVEFDKRAHHLAFDETRSQPSLETCIELADYFDLDQAALTIHLQRLASALKDWQAVAKNNALKASEIKTMQPAFVHQGFEALMGFIPG